MAAARGKRPTVAEDLGMAAERLKPREEEHAALLRTIIAARRPGERCDRHRKFAQKAEARSGGEASTEI